MPLKPQIEEGLNWSSFYVTIARDFERFQYFNFETSFFKN